MREEIKTEYVSKMPEICQGVTKWLLTYFRDKDLSKVEIPINLAIKSSPFRNLCHQVYMQDVKDNNCLAIEKMPERFMEDIWKYAIEQSKNTLDKAQCYLLAICFHWFDTIIQKHIYDA